MDKKGQELWDKLLAEQELVKSQLLSLSRKSDVMREGLAVSAAEALWKASGSFAREFQSGGIAKRFSALQGCLTDLRRFDPGYLTSLASREAYGQVLNDRQKFFVQYIFSELAKPDSSLLEILSRVHASRHIKTNPFSSRKEE